MSMKFKIDGGSKMEIEDNNTTIVSEDIKKEIEDNYEPSDKTKKEKPDLIVKD